MKGLNKIFLIFALTLCQVLPYLIPLSASEEDETPEISEDTSGLNLEISGFIENKNIISTYSRQETADINKKNEIRNNLKVQYGGERYYLRIVSNQYIIPSGFNEEYKYSDGFNAGRNGRISGDFYEINPQELYFNASFENLRFRAGNQVYGWGTADVFNPTSYFNSYDFRELVFKDDDELKNGVPSLSALLFISDYSLELVYVPVHVPARFAAAGNYWEIRYMEGPFPVYVADRGEMDISAENSGYGARFGGTFFGIDASLSGYYGPDRDPLLRPCRTVLIPNEPVSIEVNPEYYNVTYIGADISMKLDKITLQGELSFSPDKTAVISQPYTIDMELPFAITETKAISYTAGFNYYIPLSRILERHEGTTVFTAEWMQTIYYKQGLMKPFITDIITGRIEDEFISGRLKPSITCVYDKAEKALLLCRKLHGISRTDFHLKYRTVTSGAMMLQ
jgi:hypothetical protein